MTRSRVVGAALALAAAVAVLVLWPRNKPTPEEQIRQMVIQMTAAAEEKDLGFIMEQISERFRGTSPALSKQELRQILAAQILRGQWVRVFVRDIDVELRSPSEAWFRGKFIFGRSEADTLERLSAESRIQAYEVEGTLEQEDGEWRFVSGGYRVIPAGQLF
ncbi:MAG: hypothetical protein WBV82_02810 [Myxococcaceae bacterium]